MDSTTRPSKPSPRVWVPQTATQAPLAISLELHQNEEPPRSQVEHRNRLKEYLAQRIKEAGGAEAILAGYLPESVRDLLQGVPESQWPELLLSQDSAVNALASVNWDEESSPRNRRRGLHPSPDEAQLVSRRPIEDLLASL